MVRYHIPKKTRDVIIYPCHYLSQCIRGSYGVSCSWTIRPRCDTLHGVQTGLRSSFAHARGEGTNLKPLEFGFEFTPPHLGYGIHVIRFVFPETNDMCIHLACGEQIGFACYKNTLKRYSTKRYIFVVCQDNMHCRATPWLNIGIV